MKLRNYIKTHWKLLLIIAVAVFAVLAFVQSRQTKIINPETVLDLESDAGEDVARWLFNYSNVYDAIDKNDIVLGNIQTDILFFARETMEHFKNPDTLVGFTFYKSFKKEGDTHIFTGSYYGVKDKVEVRLTPQGHGVYTLSITNLQNGTNIDEQLGMNGRRNNFIKTLPINKGRYSIRYQLNEDRVVVTFYDGYSNTDVDEVANTIENAFGSLVNDSVVYSINRLGVISLEQARQNLVTPIPKP